jgi:hypothetical protein
MKTLTITALASLAFAATTFAGHEVIDNSKDKKTIIPPTCFNDHELQLDIYGTYSVGNGSSHAGPINNHGFGGGLGVNYFFTRYIGVGAEYFVDDARHNSDSVNDGHHHDGDGEDAFHHVGGSLIFRYPIDRLCLAPYAYLGGGAVLDGDSWGVGWVGVGVEYRVVPNKIGLFVDERWNYFGDRYGDGDQNNFQTRAGIRWVF